MDPGKKASQREQPYYLRRANYPRACRSDARTHARTPNQKDKLRKKERKKERKKFQRGHVKDIGSTVGETILSLSRIPGGEDNKLVGSASD